jgi:hypothetical protein
MVWRELGGLKGCFGGLNGKDLGWLPDVRGWEAESKELPRQARRRASSLGLMDASQGSAAENEEGLSPQPAWRL